MPDLAICTGNIWLRYARCSVSDEAAFPRASHLETLSSVSKPRPSMKPWRRQLRLKFSLKSNTTDSESERCPMIITDRNSLDLSPPSARLLPLCPSVVVEETPVVRFLRIRTLPGNAMFPAFDAQPHVGHLRLGRNPIETIER